MASVNNASDDKHWSQGWKTWTQETSRDLHNLHFRFHETTTTLESKREESETFLELFIYILGIEPRSAGLQAQLLQPLDSR